MAIERKKKQHEACWTMMVVEIDKSPRKTYWDKFVSSLRHTKTSAMPDVEQRQIQMERKNETPRELHPYTDHDETATRNKNPKAKKHYERQTYIQTEKAREKEELINSGCSVIAVLSRKREWQLWSLRRKQTIAQKPEQFYKRKTSINTAKRQRMKKKKKKHRSKIERNKTTTYTGDES